MFRRGLFLVLLLLCAVSSVVGLAYDRDEFLFLDEIEIGMSGIGRTIVAQDVLSEFAVDVLGIIDQPGTLSDFIVVQVSGEAIGRAGGIAQGMSGSPVYIDGKLIGAISRAANWSKAITPIGLVTPIEPMLGVLDAANESMLAAGPNPNAVLAGVDLIDANLPADPAMIAAAENTIFAYPVSTPILTSGLSERALGLLMDGSQDAPAGILSEFLPASLAPQIRGLSSLNLSLIPMASSGTGSSIDPATLGPGGSVGVAMTTGDIQVGALGTITYRDEDTLIGFGHPFISNGSSVFPMTTVSIIDTMRSYQASFKLGTLGDPIGVVLEDRMPAIGGRIGEAADLIQVTYTVEDLDRAWSRTFDFGMVDETRLIPELVLSTGFQAIDGTLDRVGSGTVEVTYRIDGDAMPKPLIRRDVFFSVQDVAVYPPWQLASIVGALEYNAFTDPELTEISASMQIVEELKAIQISDLELDTFIYIAGETLYFEVELQTFQGERLVRTGELEIPSGLEVDSILVRAYGGPRAIERGETPRVLESLGDLIEAIEEFPGYDQLTVELFVIDPYSAYAGALVGIDEATFEFPGYVLYGEREETALVVAVESPEQDAEAEETVPDW